jgi:hypothetical protein
MHSAALPEGPEVPRDFSHKRTRAPAHWRAGPQVLPSAYIATSRLPNSPIYGYGGGVAVVVVTVFVLGFLATRAEPALRVMGRTVEALSDGRFTTSMLVYTVNKMCKYTNVCTYVCMYVLQ